MAVKTKEKLESAINKALLKFLKEHLAEDAQSVASEVAGDVIIVRFKGVLPLAEKHLSEDPQGAKLIYELKMKLIEKVKPALGVLIEHVTGAKVIDVHSCFNIAAGERIEIFTLNKNL